MDRAEAERKASELNATDPGRESFRWVVFPHKNGVHTLVKVPRTKRVDPLSASTEAKPRPPQPDDPRSDLGRIAGHGI